MSEVIRIREAVASSLPAETSTHGARPGKGQFYVPASHIKILGSDASIVIGARGTGKTVWAAMLTNDEALAMLVKVEPALEGFQGLVGYGEQSQIARYPDEKTFRRLLDAEADPEDVWLGVVVRALGPLHEQPVPLEDWAETTRWVSEQPERVARALEQSDEQLGALKAGRLIVFDALDRSARDWDTMDRIVKALLRVVLRLKPFRHLRTKVFLRDDQMKRAVRDFTDASKLTATQAELSWQLYDLHALLWTQLINGPEAQGVVLRALYAEVSGTPPRGGARRGTFKLQPSDRRDSPVQRALFERLAGPWMGRDHRRGVPYTWVIGHLADARGQTSPRSFLAAIREAAIDSRRRYPAHEWPLHFESIKRGVQAASKIRVQELEEDFPWVGEAMAPLAGMTVPCELDLIIARWTAAHPGGLPDPQDAAGTSLPPQHKDSWPGLAKELAHHGVFDELRGGRINMPDLYRIGFGLGRRGGVKPIRRQP